MIEIRDYLVIIKDSQMRYLDFSKMELYLKIRDQLSKTNLNPKPRFVQGEFKNLNVDVHEEEDSIRVYTLEEYEGPHHVNPRTYLVDEKGNLKDITV